MPFSVGVLYSIQEFLELVKVTPVKASEFPVFYKSFGVASSNQILKTALSSQWVELDLTDKLNVTPKGEEILNEKEFEERLRIQLYHLTILLKPSWSSVICYGREEAVKYFTSDVYQCFKEAGLLDSFSEDVVKWWDRLGSISRNLNNDYLLEIGRVGERLSIEFEKERTGVEPVWQSIDSSSSGYDLLSIKSANDNTPLMIEVKASTRNSKYIEFHISKNEWYIASLSRNRYIFHVWNLKPRQELYILSINDISQHIPEDKGFGEWESVVISLEKDFLSPVEIKEKY